MYCGLDVTSSWSSRLVTLPPEEQLRLTLTHDLRDIVERGSLPENVKQLHDQVLNGEIFLQVLMSVDVSLPLNNEEEEQVGAKCGKKTTKKFSNYRTLKVLLTDGVTDILALEVVHIQTLRGTVGEKLSVKDGVVKRGMLLLRPGNTTVYGGYAEIKNSENKSFEIPKSEEKSAEIKNSDEKSAELTIHRQTIDRPSFKQITTNSKPWIEQIGDATISKPLSKITDIPDYQWKKKLALEKKLQLKTKNQESSQQSKQYLYIRELRPNQVAFVKGAITDTVKFKNSEDGYLLQVIFSDGNQSCVVRLDARFIENSILRVPSSELRLMKQTRKAEYKTVLLDLQTTLSRMEGIFAIEMQNVDGNISYLATDVEKPTASFWEHLLNKVAS